MKILILISFFTFIFAQDYYYNGHKKIYLSQINTISNFSYDSNITKEKTYTTKNNQVLKLSNTLIIKTKNNNIDELISKYNLVLKKLLRKNVYLLSTTQNPLEIANKIYENESVQYAYPDFIKTIQLR